MCSMAEGDCVLFVYIYTHNMLVAICAIPMHACVFINGFDEGQRKGKYFMYANKQADYMGMSRVKVFFVLRSTISDHLNSYFVGQVAYLRNKDKTMISIIRIKEIITNKTQSIVIKTWTVTLQHTMNCAGSIISKCLLYFRFIQYNNLKKYFPT